VCVGACRSMAAVRALACSHRPCTNDAACSASQPSSKQAWPLTCLAFLAPGMGSAPLQIR
jgi:hypothetical protein